MKIRDAVIGANASIYYRMRLNKIRGVYYPRTEEEVIAAIMHAREQGLDVIPKGGGSGLSGACTGGDRERVFISSLQMREVLAISKDQGYVDVQAGATPDEINAVLQKMGMKFWVAPSSRDIATVGGILSTDGGGNDAWVNGTMRDNTLRVKMVLYNGRRVTVDWKGVRSEDEELERELNRIGLSIHDIAGSHGTLGFITELRLAIRPTITRPLIGGVAYFNDCNELGAAVDRMVQSKSPIVYGEAITSAHEDIRGDLRPPLMILEFPEEYESELRTFTDFVRLSNAELKNMKDIRLKLPKRNPKTGRQLALFEDYGFFGKSLRRMQDGIEEIDSLLRRHDFIPFAKYGHAPSKWYLGDNSAAYGVILHSREIRPENISGRQIYDIVLEIVDTCERLGITPKPEHKWPYSDRVKNTRLQQLREVMGQGFNSFLLSPDCNDILGSMVG